MSRFLKHLGEYTLHEHPRSGVRVPGRRLQSGEKIHEEDLYDSFGEWKKASCPGLVLEEGCSTYWVRSSATDTALDAEEKKGEALQSLKEEE